MMLHKLLLPMDWQIHRFMAWICQSKPSDVQYHLDQYKNLKIRENLCDCFASYLATPRNGVCG